MKHKNELYLVVLSILLAASVLKSTEIFQLGDQLKDVLDPSKASHISIKTVLVFFFLSSYLLFFVLTGLATYGIVRQIAKANAAEADPDIGPLIVLCVIFLIFSHLIAFILIIYDFPR